MTAKFFLWLMVKIFIIEIIGLIRPKMTSRDQDLSFDTNNLMIGQKKTLKFEMQRKCMDLPGFFQSR